MKQTARGHAEAVDGIHAPPLDPVAEPAVLPPSTPELRQSARQLPAVLLADGPPLVLRLGGELATVGAVAELVRYPAVAELMAEEMLQPLDPRGLAEQVLEVFVPLGELCQELAT